MILDMSGTIDEDFKSSTGTRFDTSSGYVNGKYVKPNPEGVPYDVTVQGVSGRDVKSLDLGGRRVEDHRTVYINDGDLEALKSSDEWEFDNIPGRWCVVWSDVRAWRNYAKLIVSLSDDTRTTI